MARDRSSRRRFLASSASLGLWSALGGCRRGSDRRHIEGEIVDRDLSVGHRIRDGKLASAGERRPSETVPVLIVGAGVGGLSAAWRLRRAGFEDFRILELSTRAGGTARGGERDGRHFPWGAHYLPIPTARQRALVEFLRDARLVVGVDAAGRCEVPMKHRVRAPQERVCQWGFWREGLWPGDAASDADRVARDRFERLLQSFARSSPGGARPFDLPLAASSDAAKGLDTVDARSWAREQGLTGERMEWYLEYATRDDYGAALHETSAWALLHYFIARTSAVTGESGEYLTWPNGNQFLIDRLLDGIGSRLLTGQVVGELHPKPCEAVVHHVADGTSQTIRADQIVVAAPQYVVRRILRDDSASAARAEFRYGNWLVANIHVDRHPRSRGFEPCWDNVIYQSPSLGYVDAGHQADDRSPERVLTWYLPLLGDDVANRARLYDTPWRDWRDLILNDLRAAHPDIDERVRRIDVWRWGHAMIKPVPRFLWGDSRRAAAVPVGGIHFAHSDVGGLALFEEAHWAGVRAAEEVLTARGVSFESLLG